MGKGEKLQGRVSGEKQKPVAPKLSELARNVLKHLCYRESKSHPNVKDVLEDINFEFDGFTYKIEQSQYIYGVELFRLDLEGKILMRMNAHQTFLAWELRTPINFRRLAVKLLAKTKKIVDCPESSKDDWRKVLAVRKELTEEQKKQFDKKMIPSEQIRFLRSHWAWREEV